MERRGLERGRKGLYFYVPNAEERTILAEFSRVAEADFFGIDRIYRFYH